MTTLRDEIRPATAALSSAPVVGRRRGRPYRLPSDPTPITEPVPSLNHRLAWLLGSSRVYASDPQLARRAIFIQALQDVGVVADTTKLSRWESGRAPVPMAVVRAYEQVLGLPRGQLTVGATGLARIGDRPSTRADEPQSDPTQAHLVLDGLFEQVLAGRAPGHIWLELCSHLTRQRYLYLLPDTWRQVSDLLATELSRSSGLAFVSRFEALRMLVAHPGSQRHTVRAIGAVVTDPASVFMIHPLALLQEVDDEQAWDLLVRLLKGTPSTLRGGASWAVAGKVARGNLAAPDLEIVATIALTMLKKSRTASERLDALNLIRSLPADCHDELDLSRLDDDTQASCHLAQRSAELRDAQLARSISSRIAETAVANTAIDHIVNHDQMLDRLVREALFHVDHARRNQAALLLAASPYRAQLGDPLVELATKKDEGTAVIACSALFLIADRRQRGKLLELALGDKRAAVRTTALMSLGQVIGEVTPDEGAQLRALLSRTGSKELRSAALRALGMSAADCLVDLAAGGPHAEAAGSWLNSRPIVEPMARG